MVDVGPTAPKAQQAAQLHGLECTMMNGAEVSDMFPGNCRVLNRYTSAAGVYWHAKSQ